MNDTQADSHVHFETRADKPAVFRMTAAQIAEAKARSGLSDVRTSLGEDLQELGWLKNVTALVTSNDIVCDPKFPLNALGAAAPKLRWIQIIGAGIEPLLPLDWLPETVQLINNSGVHFEKAREGAIMALLMLNARLPAIATNQRKARWEQIFTPSIVGRTVLVIGVGDIGGAAASAAKALRLHVIGVRRTGKPHPHVDRMVTHAELDAVLPEADFVILATPLTPESRNLLDRRRIGLMKKEASLLNVGRAGLLDHDALVDALGTGAVSGAMLDVFNPEPLPSSSPLWNTDKLFLTPHVTSDDLHAYLPKTLDLAFANVQRQLRGESLSNVVDRKRGY